LHSVKEKPRVLSHALDGSLGRTDRPRVNR
jgi:hypothetical protein